MKKWTVLFDVERCNGCCNCVLATKDEYVDNRYPGYAEEMPKHGHKWLDIECVERGAYPSVDVAYLARMCQHCEDPPCAKAAPEAVTRRDDGIVIIDPVKARGAHALVQACPVGAIHWNEALQLPQHWNMDAHLLDAGWTDTRASQACPTGALQLHKLDDAAFARLKAEGGAAELEPSLGLRGRVLYRNLHRVRARFIEGSLVSRSGGAEQCAAGVPVELRERERQAVVASATSDAFGDFRFDGLPADPEVRYELSIRSPGGIVRHPVELRGSGHLGVIAL